MFELALGANLVVDSTGKGGGGGGGGGGGAILVVDSTGGGEWGLKTWKMII